ncbi:MAG: hypothetical protein QOE90_1735 [Thermoplasmata archaeon]|nr:hypothetical protein [Thermoplasmata archaeon]
MTKFLLPPWPDLRAKLADPVGSCNACATRLSSHDANTLQACAWALYAAEAVEEALLACHGFEIELAAQMGKGELRGFVREELAHMPVYLGGEPPARLGWVLEERVPSLVRASLLRLAHERRRESENAS